MSTAPATLPARARALLEAWFGAPGEADAGQARRWWFRSDAATDARLRLAFGADQADAATGRLDAWQGHPEACLALVLLLDQLPRHFFRGSAAAYACDARARAVAAQARAAGHDLRLEPLRRQFLYLPLAHSEEAADQALSLALYEALEALPGSPVRAAAARRAHALVARFGRFPARNAALGRHPTAEEAAFLAGRPRVAV